MELRLLDDLEALAIRLKHAVLDAVMHHLDEVPGAGRAHVAVAIGRGERLEDWLAVVEDRLVAADHQAVALFQPPDAATGAAVEIVHARGGDFLPATDGVVKVRVAAVNDDVARLEQAHDMMKR